MSTGATAGDDIYRKCDQAKCKLREHLNSDMADKELSHWACRLEVKILHMPFYQPHVEDNDCLEKTVKPNCSHFQAQY